MNKRVLKWMLIVLIINPSFCFGQISKLWEVYLPSESNYLASFNSNSNNHLKTIQTPDDCFVTLASKQWTDFEFGSRIYLFKYNKYGEIIWEYTYENSREYGEYPMDITIDQEGDIIVSGKAITFYQSGFEREIVSANYLLLKISQDAELIWEKEIEGEKKFVNYCSSIVIDSLGNIYTTGKIAQNDTNYVVVNKFNSLGVNQWTKNVNTDISYSINLVNNQLFVVTKRYSSPSRIYRFNLSGEMLDSFSIDRIHLNKPVFDKNGNLYNFQFNGDFKIEKYNSTGNLQWIYHKETNLPPNVIADELRDCFIDEDGNVFVTGRFYGKHYGDKLLYTNSDILTVKLDILGNVVWENIYKYDNKRSGQIGDKIKLDKDGNTYVLGHQTVELNGDLFASDDMVLLVYNDEGELIDSVYHDGINKKEDYGITFFLDDDDIYVLGYSQNEEELFDYNVIKYSKTTVNSFDEEHHDNIVIYPNPSTGSINFNCDSKVSNLSVFSSPGNMIFHKKNFNSNFTIDLGGNPSGIYYINYVLNKNKYSKPIVLYEH